MRKVVSYIMLGSVAAAISCADNHILPSSVEEVEHPGTGIAFEATVIPSRNETRADGSLVNRLETSLPATKERTYWVPETDVDGNLVFDEYGNLSTTSKKATYYAGIFGVYTKQYTWNELMALAATEFTDRAALASSFPALSALTSEDEYSREKASILSDNYTADFFFNQQAGIGEVAAEVNPLTYTPERFWPNSKIGATADYQRTTFWAYYPWNATDDPGVYGISITEEDVASGMTYGVGKGQGMGSVKFTMHPDASEHNDFLISDLVTDCSKGQYPLMASAAEGDAGWTPKRVPFTFHHMLAQVRLYAFIRGTDRLAYIQTGTDGEGNPVYLKATAEDVTAEKEITDAWGMTRKVREGELIPDDTEWATGYVASNVKTVRWERTTTLSPSGERYRAKATLTMAFNNIHTTCIFAPRYDAVTGKASVSYTDVGTLGSATVNHYIQNPYWFYFDKKDNDKRVMLNDAYMYDYFEDTDGYNGTQPGTEALNLGELDWSTKGPNALGYLTNEETADRSGIAANAGKHYNYAPGNIILAVPQVMDDNDVPNITVVANGRDTKGNRISGKVTINMLQMNLKWEPGFIYCYAFVDELMPGDDKVRGPETITVVFDPTRITDQW